MVTQINDNNILKDSTQLYLMCRICMMNSDGLKDVISYELTPNICRMLNYCTQLNVSINLIPIQTFTSILNTFTCIKTIFAPIRTVFIPEKTYKTYI